MNNSSHFYANYLIRCKVVFSSPDCWKYDNQRKLNEIILEVTLLKIKALPPTALVLLY